MATTTTPAWMTKHPCTGCGVGYIECAQGWVMSLMCCKDCEHPTRWQPDPYTAAEYEDMQRVAAEKEQS